MLTSAYVEIFRTVTRNERNENQSASKLDINRKTSPCSPRTPIPDGRINESCNPAATQVFLPLYSTALMDWISHRLRCKKVSKQFQQALSPIWAMPTRTNAFSGRSSLYVCHRATYRRFDFRVIGALQSAELSERHVTFLAIDQSDHEETLGPCHVCIMHFEMTF